MKKEVDWVIILSANGVSCGDCGKVEDGFLPYACDAHTEGMNRYGHPEFQMVIKYPQDHIM